MHCKSLKSIANRIVLTRILQMFSLFLDRIRFIRPPSRFLIGHIKCWVSVNRELKVLGKRIGLAIPLTTDVARHTYATVLKRSGVNIAIISESLGHSDLATTQIYLDSFENFRRSTKR